MIRSAALLSLATLVAVVVGQQAGTQTPETHPPLTWQSCKAGGTCTTNSASVVLDANWRWVHTTTGYTNCYTGNEWDATICPDPVTCAANCALDGADYETTYGISSSGDALTLAFVTGTNVGSRNYLMAPGSTTEYQMFKPLNQEFTFDVDVSQLGCGLNGALYFSEMAADGGMAANPGNKAGAKFGTGYCDSQCPKDLKFVNGEANMLNWTGTSTNSGTGSIGSCCNEMDIWEANSISSAVTPHPCSGTGLVACTGTTCTTTCDQAGCDFNSYRMGDLTFYGPGMTVDTTKTITVVTQFLTDDGTATGTLSEIKRFYVQNGVVIPNSMSNIPTMTEQFNSVSEDFCVAQKTAFGDTNTFDQQGGMATVGKAFANGVVLVLSIWDDYAVDMLWLDSDYPTTSPATNPGVARGTCATTSGVPSDVESSQASDKVVFSNIKFGDINSTFTGSTSGTPPPTNPTTVLPPPSTPTTPTNGATQTHYGQCGGIGYTGPTVCASPYTCDESNAYYSQCL